MQFSYFFVVIFWVVWMAIKKLLTHSVWSD